MGDTPTADDITLTLERLTSHITTSRLLLLDLERACILRGSDVLTPNLETLRKQLAEIHLCSMNTTNTWIDGS